MKRSSLVWLFVLLVLLGLLGYKAWRVDSLALSLKARLDRWQSLDPAQLDLQDLTPMIGDVHAARSELRQLRSELAPLLWLAPYLGWLPGYGAELEAAPALMDMAVELADAGDGLLAGLEPQVSSLQEGGLSIQRAVELIEAIGPALGPAQAQLDKAVLARARVTRPLSPRAAALLAKADKILPLASTALDLLALAPDLLGFDQARTYLVLAQNSDELRPTGGFISSVGRVVIQRGEIISVTFEDSYAVDDYQFSYPDAPPELLAFMGSEIWVFRDSNWSPDFPSSAQAAIRLYQISRPGRIDGVIAVNLQAMPVLLEGLGPLSVSGFDQPVTGQNALEAMRQALMPEPDERISTEWWLRRKDFTGALAEAALARIQSDVTPQQAMRLALAVMQVLDRRDVLVYLESSQAQHLLAQRKWDGALAQTQGDYVMVVDSNLGFNKVNPNIDEQMSYSVQLDKEGSGKAALALVHTSRARPEQPACNHSPRYDKTYDGMMNRCYWDLVRVYAPSGSALISATLQAPAPLIGKRSSNGQATTLQDQGFAVFESFFALQGGARQVTRFEYTLPPVARKEADGWVYTLYLQRQPATNNWPIEITLALPDGARLLRAEPPVIETGQALQWALHLSTDQHVQVWYNYP